MIKEISQVTNKSSYTYVVTKQSADYPDSISAVMTSVEPDVFIEDDYKADWMLVEDIKNTCISTNHIEILTLKRTLPVNTSKVEHYSNIMAEAYERASAHIYMNTKRFVPNYIIASSDISPVLEFCRADGSYIRNANMPYEGTVVWGWYRDLPVIVSYKMNPGEMIWGANHELTPGIITFVADKKVCNKIANTDNFVLIKLED
jgi:hypothetical protein